MKPIKNVLDNGVTVLFEHRKTESVAVEVLVKVGSDYEREGNRGVSHFIEHMVFEGTKTRTAKQIAELIENTGGELNAATYQDRTSYYVVVPKKHFKKAFAVLADLLINPLFELRTIEKEKNVVLEEIALLEDDSLHYTFKHFVSTLFEKLPARYMPYGTRESISALTQEQIVNFFREYYVGRNFLVSIVGDVPRPFQLVHRFFGAMPKGEHSSLQLPKEPEQTRHKIKRLKKNTQHAYVVYGFQTPAISEKDYYTLEVVKALLAKGQSSRLFHEARTKRGLCYSISAINEANIHCGFFAVFFSADKKNVEKVLALVREQLQLDDLTRDEFQHAKDFLVGNFLLMHERAKDSAESRAFWYMLHKEPQSYVREIRKVTLRDVRTCVKRYFKKHTLVITSP